MDSQVGPSAFETARVVVHPGPGLVARFPGVVVVCADAAAGPAARLLDLCRTAALVPSPGRPLARRLAAWLTESDESLDFGVLAETDDGLAVFLCADAVLRRPGTEDLAGTQSAAWLDRLVGWPDGALELRLGSGPGAPVSTAAALGDLRSGVVPGAGLTVTADIVSPAEPAPSSGPLRLPAPIPPTETIDRPSLGVPTPHTGFTVPIVGPPRSSGGERPDAGARPSRGMLVFDDGTRYPLDTGYLLGRHPDADDRVRSGALRALVVADTQGLVSRAHLVIKFDGPYVVAVDTGSANGTFVALPNETAWSTMPAGVSVRLPIGTRVGIGDRSFTVEASR